ncbi:ATP-binding protein [Myxococcota bacterium]|nr:ATP-binding protein [Myxococcota bacterium]
MNRTAKSKKHSSTHDNPPSAPSAASKTPPPTAPSDPSESSERQPSTPASHPSTTSEIQALRDALARYKVKEDFLRNVSKKTSHLTGEAFLCAIVQEVALGLDIPDVLIAEKNGPQLRTVALWKAGTLYTDCPLPWSELPCFYTPKDDEGICRFVCEKRQTTPCPLVQQQGLGIPLHNHSLEVIGYFCVADHDPLEYIEDLIDLLKILASRIAAELEHRQTNRSLQALNQELEQRVLERTQALHTSEQKYRTLFEENQDAVMLLHNEHFLDCNRATLQLFGCETKEQFHGKRPADFSPSHQSCGTPTPQRAQHELSIAFQQGKHRFEWLHQRLDGTIFPAEVWLTAIPSQIPAQIIAVVRDISAQKQAEEQRNQHNEQLQRANEELDQATRHKDEFLANMSHELRTPLNVILGMSEGLQEGIFGPLSKEHLQALRTIERSGRHLLELINDILDLAKIEAGRLSLQEAPVPVHYLCETSLSFVRQMAQQKNIALTHSIQQGVHEMILDERRMRQVLLNLLNNAVKFTPEHGKVELSVFLQTQENNERYVCFSVSDTGIGLKSEDLGRLFQSFVQIDSRLNRQHQGTGLGLALVKRIVDLHGGIVQAESVVGQGSRFTACLPAKRLLRSLTTTSGLLKTVRLNADVTKATPSDESAPPLLLLVEDNEANTNTVSRYLESRGYQVLSASNGIEALQSLEKHTPALILMDIQMPVMDGLEAIRHIRLQQRWASIPIVALTALTMPGDRERCLAVGATEYLAKPFRLKHLRDVIQKMLKQASSEK